MNSVYEEKNCSRAIMRVGLPAMLGQLTTLIYNLADTFFVSLTKEPAMIAAVTLCAPILLIIMSIACIFGMGGSSVIARLLGEEKRETAGTTMNFCVYAMAFFGVITLVLGLAFLRPLAKVSGADAENIAYTCDYLQWIFIGAPFIMLANGFVHLFRSAGLIKEGTVGLVLGNGINMVLDYIFIALLGWGKAGAALATSLGFACATVYYLACMIREERKGNPLVPLTPKRFSPDMGMIRSIVSIGIPGALITVLMSVSNIVLNNYIGIYGSNAVASYGIAYKLDMIPILLPVGLSQGVAPLVGYCYGVLPENPLPVSSYAWRDPDDNRLFSGFGKSGKIPYDYRPEKCRAVYPGRNSLESLLAIGGRNCGTAGCRNDYNDHLPVYVSEGQSFGRSSQSLFCMGKNESVKPCKPPRSHTIHKNSFHVPFLHTHNSVDTARQNKYN